MNLNSQASFVVVFCFVMFTPMIKASFVVAQTDSPTWREPTIGNFSRNPASDSNFTDADYRDHLKQLRKKLPNEGFTIVVEKPFVVIGDESADVVRRRSERTVAWAVRLLKKQYFSRDPNHIIDIWLFKDKQSYEKHNLELFGSKPSTPYGFYSSTNKALVMNISTGGGTLVHEIVHPFMESNFENCPSWFNEGLASLYEQCAEREGKITGLTNWRLRGLQGAISADRVPSFKTLCSTTTREFYNEDRGTNYSQARYLCYYLQEQGKLNAFYHDFVRNSKNDSTGYRTLQRTLGNPDMVEFQRRWQAYVMKLKF